MRDVVRRGVGGSAHRPTVRAEVQPAEVSDSSMARLRHGTRPASGVTTSSVTCTGMSAAVPAAVTTATSMPTAAAVLGNDGRDETRNGQDKRKGSPCKEGSLAAHGLSTSGRLA